MIDFLLQAWLTTLALLSVYAIGNQVRRWWKEAKEHESK